MTAMFVDLKATFDSVDRGKLGEAMKERGVRKGLRRRVEEVMKEIRCRIKTRRELGESFWTEKGVRQGCPLCPMLFNILTADLEEKLGKVKKGGIKIGEKRICTLAYTDDMVLLVEEEN